MVFSLVILYFAVIYIYIYIYRVNKGNITEFNCANDSDFQLKVTGKTGDGGLKMLKQLHQKKYLSNVCRNHEMALINCEKNIFLNCSPTFAITVKSFTFQQ